MSYSGNPILGVVLPLCEGYSKHILSPTNREWRDFSYLKAPNFRLLTKWNRCSLISWMNFDKEEKKIALQSVAKWTWNCFILRAFLKNLGICRFSVSTLKHIEYFSNMHKLLHVVIFFFFRTFRIMRSLLECLECAVAHCDRTFISK